MEGSPAATSGGPGGMVSLSRFYFTSDTHHVHLYQSHCQLARETTIPFIAIAFSLPKIFHTILANQRWFNGDARWLAGWYLVESRVPVPFLSRASP